MNLAVETIPIATSGSLPPNEDDDAKEGGEAESSSGSSIGSLGRSRSSSVSSTTQQQMHLQLAEDFYAMSFLGYKKSVREEYQVSRS